MGDAIAAIMLVFVSAYIAACAVFFPAYLIDEHLSERACAEQHQVYACERGDWKPVEITK